jgi:hypothetical protein
MNDLPLVFVVGLQKSGTTLLLKLLTSTQAFRNPVKFEGKELWGDEPSFTPTAYPAGEIYQRDGGAAGHEIGADDATDAIRTHVQNGLRNFGASAKALVLKNPYNTVRVPWIRALFPESYIIAVVRRPLPNVFSLMKKHTPNPSLRQGAEDGWWGVKPAGWRELVQDDKLAQSATQWDRVNAKLWSERDLIDRFVAYHEVGADPASVVSEIAMATIGQVPEMNFPKITVLDDEYVEGGRLQSANVIARRTKSLDLAGDERRSEYLAAFTADQRETILKICTPTAEALGLGA